MEDALKPLRFPDVRDGIMANRIVLENMPGTGIHALMDEGGLDSAIHRAINLVLYKEARDVFDVAAALAFGLVENHAFENGNHRTAYILTHEFLARNGYPLVVDRDDVEFAEHLLGYTLHGRAKRNDPLHTPEETAAMFRRRHEELSESEDPAAPKV